MYDLDTNAARQADHFNSRIETTGKYIGKFTLAENVLSKNNVEGVEFSFKSDDGQSADYLTLWTINAKGEKLHGFKTLNAIMTILKARTITPVAYDAEKYDHELKAKTKVRVSAFRELMDKPIGLLLQKEFYRGNDGTTKSKMIITLPFGAATGFTASEIIDRATKAEIMERVFSQLKDRPLKDEKQFGATHEFLASTTSNDFDQDIPF